LEGSIGLLDQVISWVRYGGIERRDRRGRSSRDLLENARRELAAQFEELERDQIARVFVSQHRVNDKTILLAEDGPDDVVLGLRVCAKAGIKNRVVARDGVEALDYLFGTGDYEGRATRSMPSLLRVRTTTLPFSMWVS
jgi:hypothetical protein